MSSIDTHATSYDAVVVGARVAGAATALGLARRGHRVLLVDRATFPSDTLSTHAIARTGVLLLDRWGLLGQVLASGAPAIREVAFHRDDDVVRRRIKDRHGVDHLIAPRRHILDMILIEAAVDAGAELWTSTTVTDVTRRDDGRVTGIVARRDEVDLSVAARIVVGADGLRSRIARQVGAAMLEERPAGGALHYAYYEGDWPAMEYYIGNGSTAGIFPTHHDAACIWVSNPTAEARAARRAEPDPVAALEAMIRRTAPDLHVRLATSFRTSVVRGMIGLPNHRRRSVGEGWALVGDAAYHRDAITGHGISDSFRDAELLAVTLDRIWSGMTTERDGLAAYAAE